MSAVKDKISAGYSAYLFHEGTNYRSYRFLGAHIECRNRIKGVVFRVWAPNAVKVAVVGSFNAWDVSAHPMRRCEDAINIWELFIPGLKHLDVYKYAVTSQNGNTVLKADPYAFYSEIRPGNASKVYNLSGYKWNDKNWRKYCRSNGFMDKPVNIYELHIGSWKRDEKGDFYSYARLAEELIPYVKSMGFTHVELMPVSEFPFDGSWGYQVTGYFAPTSRYGDPKEFMAFVDKCHQNGIGVIIDWVPAHFPKDESGLYEFDGSCLYEYTDELKREHTDWGTRIFDYGKMEVRSFLISSAFFWVEYYHIDGIRVDAVASMLYLDYGRMGRAWRPNIYGGNQNLEAADFLKHLNSVIGIEYPEVMMIAEESTAWPMVTLPPHDGGLGFHMKWNMGWMNDTLKYFETDPVFRRHCHNNLTFSISYAFSENYILPFSHDEVVHGKRSLIEKQPGNYTEKFAGLRAMIGYKIAFPGKKLTFMGNEFAQFIEWNYSGGLDWFLLEYDMHQKYHNYIRSLNQFYLSTSAFWELDFNRDGFIWINPDDSDMNIISFRRKGKNTDDEIIVVCNFAPVLRENYIIGVPCDGAYKEVFNSDLECFGGSGAGNRGQLRSTSGKLREYENLLEITVPPMSVMFFKMLPKTIPNGRADISK